MQQLQPVRLQQLAPDNREARMTFQMTGLFLCLGVVLSNVNSKLKTTWASNCLWWRTFCHYLDFFITVWFFNLLTIWILILLIAWILTLFVDWILTLVIAWISTLVTAWILTLLPAWILTLLTIWILILPTAWSLTLLTAEFWLFWLPGFWLFSWTGFWTFWLPGFWLFRLPVWWSFSLAGFQSLPPCGFLAVVIGSCWITNHWLKGEEGKKNMFCTCLALRIESSWPQKQSCQKAWWHSGWSEFHELRYRHSTFQEAAPSPEWCLWGCISPLL